MPDTYWDLHQCFSLNTWAAATKCYKLGALNNRHLTVPKPGKPKSKGLVVPGENRLPGLLTATILLVHGLSLVHVQGESKMSVFLFL